MVDVVNPFSGDPLPKDAASFVTELREVRKGARNAQRSGHPGKRAEARRINEMVPGMISVVYSKNA